MQTRQTTDTRIIPERAQPAGLRVSRRHMLAMTAATAGAMYGGVTISPAAAQDTAVVRGGSLHGANISPVTSMDPYTSKGSFGDVSVYRAIYNYLLELDPTGNLVPELATEWVESDDGLTYTFTLQEGVTFHDGTPLDAAAIKFNLERYKEEGSTFTRASLLQVISSIDAPDPATLVITLSAPNAPFLVTLTDCPIVSPTAVEELGEDFQLKGVGSGAFKTESWNPGSTATLVRNENYWEIAPDGDPYPLLDEIVIDGMPDDSTMLLNLRSGEFDIVERVNPRDQASLASDPNIQLIETSHMTAHLIAMNVTKPPFDNQNLRLAVAAAIDRQAIIDNISFGTGYTTPMPFPRQAWYYVGEPSPVYDTEAARQLLTDAGYPDGIDITMTHINRTVDTQIAQIVKAQLEAVGIRMTIESLERTTWVDMWRAHEGEIGLLVNGAAATDPSQDSSFWSVEGLGNWAGYDSPEARELIAQASQTTDQADRLALWQQVAEITVNDSVYVFIGAIPTVVGARSSLQDVGLVTGSQWELTKTSIEE